jgi:hypothetical protein
VKLCVEYLHTFIRFPNTLRIFCAGMKRHFLYRLILSNIVYPLGLNVAAFSPMLDALEQEQLLGKLVILRGANDLLLQNLNYAVPSLSIEELFSSSTSRAPVFPLEASSSSPNSGGSTSPKTLHNGTGRQIDPSIVRQHYRQSEPLFT